MNTLELSTHELRIIHSLLEIVRQDDGYNDSKSDDREKIERKIQKHLEDINFY